MFKTRTQAVQNKGTTFQGGSFIGDMKKQNTDTQNAAAIIRVMEAVGKAQNEEVAARAALDTIRSAFNWAYGSYWKVDKEQNALRFAVESGTVTPEFTKVTQEASFKEGVGLSGRTWQSRDLIFVQDLGTVTDCCRREPAQRAGVKSGVCFPVIIRGEVIGTMDFFALETLTLSEDQHMVLKSVGQLVSEAIERLQNLETQRQATADSNAVSQVLQNLGNATTTEEAVKTALDTVRSSFNWAYGSYWVVNPREKALRFAIESGTVTPEFTKVTQEARFQEGVGLSGKTWMNRDLVFVKDLGTVTDCCRREPAQRAGVKSGVCFPIILKGEVVGTMDFFALETLSPTQERLDALRTVGRLVSTSLERIQKAESEKKTAQQIKHSSQELTTFSDELNNLSQTIYNDAEHGASQAVDVSSSSEQVNQNVQTVAAATEELSASIREIAKNAIQAASITERAESRALASKEIVDTLGKSAKEIGNVIEVIKNIASQTNLLALNATIEAASAGDAGKGFAVVANEVKELAKQSAIATEDIRSRIEEIQKNTNEAVKAIEEISEIVMEVSQINQTIASAVEEQSATTNEISRNIQVAAKGSTQISQNILGLAELSRKTATSASSLGKLNEMLDKLKGLISQI